MNITFLNAANFDFSGKLSASYLGLFNVFSPTNKIHGVDKHLGFIAGIEKINYSNGNINGNDSSQVEYFHQNALINPLDYSALPYDTIKAGAKYLRQYNKFTFTEANTVWSFYIQPTWRLSAMKHKYNRDGIYLHFHFELLINEWNRTATIQNIAQDTQVVTNTQTRNSFNLVNPTQIVSNYTFASGYFGTGFTFYLTPFYKDTTIHFFFQPTFGVTINSPNFSVLNNRKIPPNPNGTYPVNYITNNSKGFYLVRANYIQSFSSTSQLIIGFLVRGLFPSENPQYAAYLGLNLDLKAILKLFSN